MIRRVFIAAFLCAVQMTLADDFSRPVLDAVIARATKPVTAPAAYTDSADQRGAVEELAAWPVGNADDEALIAAALKQVRASPEPTLRNAAHLTLGRRNHRELLPEYFRRIESQPDELRLFLSLMPDRETNPPVESLGEALRSADPRARTTGLELIEWCKARELRPEIERLLRNDPSQELRAKAATTLWLLGCRESVPALRQALRGSPDTQRTIGWALANLGSDTEVEALAPLLGAKSPETRALIAKGMGRLHLTDPKPAIAAVLPLLEDETREVRIAAAITLGKLKEPRAVPTIQALLNDAESPQGEDRDDILRALGAIGDEAAVTMLNRMPLSDPVVQEELLRLARPSSAYAAWDAYLCDATKLIPGVENPAP